MCETIDCTLNQMTATKADVEKCFQNNYTVIDDRFDKKRYTETQCRKILVAEDIFDFTCYSDDIALYYGEIFTDVVKAIQNKTTFEYINQSNKHHIDYIMVASLLDKAHILNWGTSIRGAWFDRYKVYDTWPDPEISEGVIEWICEIE